MVIISSLRVIFSNSRLFLFSFLILFSGFCVQHCMLRLTQRFGSGSGHVGPRDEVVHDHMAAADC